MSLTSGRATSDLSPKRYLISDHLLEYIMIGEFFQGTNHGSGIVESNLGKTDQGLRDKQSLSKLSRVGKLKKKSANKLFRQRVWMHSKVT